ncbi:MAG: Ferredoxin--NADP reductase, partial [Sporomusa sp.]|nr:Ferredoxin--NADP reductase [Sporomusa sp.]
EAYRLVLEYTPFPGSVCGAVCRNLCMDECTRKTVDISAQIGKLGSYSADAELPQAEAKTGKHVAVIGGGAAGLTAAWQLARLGHEVTVFEADAKVGGKMEQVIPRSRLPQSTLASEIARIEKMGVTIKTGVTVDKEKFSSIKDSHDAVVVTTGAHITKVISWPGQERVVKGLDFLKAINRGEHPGIGKKVIVIGCGNSGMDVAVGAYGLGAEQVTCIDVQRPAAFEHEIAHVKALGGEILWPVFTKEVTAEGIVTQDGQLIKGDTVIISIGESPDLGFVPAGIEFDRGCLKPAADYSVAPGIFTAGDTIRPGRLVDAIGAGRQAALAANAYLNNSSYAVTQKEKISPDRMSTAYFKKCHSCDVPEATGDYNRCISCGTCRDCHMCLKSCPENAITRIAGPTGAEYVSDPNKCIGCGICSGICPCGVWNMDTNAEPIQFYR